MSLDLFPEDRARMSRTLRATPIADTVDGTNWAIKALHPADGDAVPRGMPTLEALPIVNLQWQQEDKLALDLVVPDASPNPPTTWDLDIILYRHPVLFGAYRRVAYFVDGSKSDYYGLIGNDQLIGPNMTYEQFLTDGSYKLAQLCEQYRITYAGFTAHLQANATANQGAVTAAQFDFVPSVLSSTVTTADDVMMITPQVCKYLDSVPSWRTISAMPHAYTNDAKHGCYMPLKLSDVDDDWHPTNQAQYIVGDWDGSATNWYDGVPAKAGVISTGESVALNRLFSASPNKLVMGHPPGRTVGYIAFRGLDPEATVNLVSRVGVDMKVSPNTQYAPFMHNPPVYDGTAMRMYYEIARRMADGYPASYNATGDLLKVVMDIAAQLMPLVEPHAKEILEKLTQKINSSVQRAVGAGRKRGRGQPKKKGEGQQNAPAAETPK